MISDANEKFTHRDPLVVRDDKLGSENSRKRLPSKSRSSERCGPTGNPIRSGKDPELRKTSG